MATIFGTPTVFKFRRWWGLQYLGKENIDRIFLNVSSKNLNPHCVTMNNKGRSTLAPSCPLKDEWSLLDRRQAMKELGL